MRPMVERAGFAGIVLILLLSLVLPVLSDPVTDGSSIDCGSTGNYTDGNGITWTTDGGFIATGKNVENITVEQDPEDIASEDTPGMEFINNNQSQTLRFFDQGRTRDCYVLPVTPGFNYLVRPTFYFGDWKSPSNYTAFNVFLNANNWIVFQFNSGPDYKTYTFEAVVYVTTGNTLDVCLVRTAGTPFISSLELRKLDHGMYSTAVGDGKFLGMAQRYNTGANISDFSYLRYPDDAYDRIWYTPGSFDNVTHVTNTTSVPISDFLTPERPPVKVMESYWTYPQANFLYLTEAYTAPVGSIAVYSYFQEVDNSVNASYSRGMDYYVNTFLLDSFNSTKQPYESGSCVLDITETTVNVSLFQASWSQLKPILNAVEIYFVYDWNDTKTAIEDVTTMQSIQRMFNLTDWYGDPCIPVPYDWLGCEVPSSQVSGSNKNQTTDQVVVANTAYVTSMSLANIAVLETFPEEVLLLSQLSFVNFSNTRMQSIPSTVWRQMENITTLDISSNKMSGDVADFVNNITGTETNLQRLYAENNSFEGEFPLEQFFTLFPKLEAAYFDKNTKIGGVLNVSSFMTALVSPGSNNNTANYSGKVAATPASAAKTFPVISLTNNGITGITPDLDYLSDDINNYLRSRMSFNNLNGVLLGGNPWCQQTDYEKQSLPQQYLCRTSTSESLPGIVNLHPKSGTNVGAIVGGVVGGVAVLFLIVILVALWKLHRRSSSLKEIQEALAKQKVQPPFYSYAALRAATQDFSADNKLGQGSFGAVYKGTIVDTTAGTEELVAVKKLYQSKQALSEFLNEAVLITGIKHRNLVQLKGCCIHKEDERMLVYEYAANGNLAEALWDAGRQNPEGQAQTVVPTVLDWQQRLNVCIGIARGLAYLHEELQPRIIHRDIKPGNILLDENYNAKIADFGLARSILEGQTEADFTQIAGTKGYFSPEYATQGQLTEKADVFSFGVVLLEIVSGRGWFNERLPPEKRFLQAWARSLKNEGKILDLLDPKVRKTAHDDEVIRVITIAFLCLEFEPSRRPSMAETVTMLQGVMSVTLYNADSDASSTFRSPARPGVQNYMRLQNSPEALLEEVSVDSFDMSVPSSTQSTTNHGIEFSRLSAR